LSANLFNDFARLLVLSGCFGSSTLSFKGSFSSFLKGSFSFKRSALLYTMSRRRMLLIVGRFLKSLIKHEWTISPRDLE